MSFGRRGLLRRASALVCVFAAIGCFAAAGASAAVYWGDVGTIGAANLDGAAANYRYFKPPFPSDSASPTCGLAASDSYLYWAGAFAIGRVNFEGPATPATISPHLQRPCGVAIDGFHVYWTDSAAGTIGRANLDGSEPNPTFISGLDRPCAVAVDGSGIYWSSWRGIGRANLDGSHVEANPLSIVPSGCGLALDSRYVYWTSEAALNQRGIGRVSRDGLFRQPGFISGLEGVASIAVDPGHVYWTDQPEGMTYGSIGRADIDGTAAIRSWIPTQKFNLEGVAVDARPTPPPLPLPSRPIRFGKLSHNLQAGTAVLNVDVPERGELLVTAPGIGWKVLKGPEPPPYRFGSFRWRLKLWPGKTRFGKNLRTRLRNKGRAVTLKLSYAEEGQLPYLATKRLTLRKTKNQP